MNTQESKNQSSGTFSHLDSHGTAQMVNVGGKPEQMRRAIAKGCLTCRPETIQLLRDKALPKGDVLTVAKIAGIQEPRTAELIPLCHPLSLAHIAVDFEIKPDSIHICCQVETAGQTGVEMEALTGVSVAALTLYDMCKAVDRSMRIEDICVVSKVKE